MIEKPRMDLLVQRFIDAWNSHDVERLMACYTDDLVYWDVIVGKIEGKEAFRPFISSLFDTWQMTWSLREALPLGDRDGVVALWHVIFQRRGDERTVEFDGLDLAVLEGDLVKRNEIYFNAAALAELM
jgi:ketosteroid isomerase-like protein